MQELIDVGVFLLPHIARPLYNVAVLSAQRVSA
jgi:hypothetical protein